MKIFGEKDVLLMTELKIDTMSQNETTKLDIIVAVSYTHLTLPTT